MVNVRTIGLGPVEAQSNHGLHFQPRRYLPAMDDLRNKMRKIEETEAQQERLKRLLPPRPAPQIARCQCGHTYYDTDIWALQRADMWRTTSYHCAAGLPAEYRWLTEEG